MISVKNRINFIDKSVLIAELFILAGFLFLHLIFLENSESVFIEYDNHFFILSASILLGLKSIHRLMRNPRCILRVSRLSLFIIGFVLYIIIHSAVIGINNYTLIVKIILLAALYFLIEDLFRRVKYHHFILSIFLLAVFLVQISLMFNISLVTFRSFSNPLTVISGGNACFLVAEFPFIFSLLFQFKKATNSNKLFFFSVCLVTLVNVYLLIVSHSRTSWVACGASSFLILYYQFRKKKGIIKVFESRVFKFFICFTLLLTLILIAIALYRFNPGSANGRILIYRVGLRMMSEHPIFGLGIGQFKDLYNLFQGSYFANNSSGYSMQLLAGDVFYAFNEYLHIGIELGIIGLLFFIALCVEVFKIFRKTNKKDLNNLPNILMFGSFASLFSISIAALFSYPFSILSVNFLAIIYLAIMSSQTEGLRARIPFIYFGNIILIALIIFIFSKAVVRMNAFRKWEIAAKLAESDRFVEAKLYYEQCYPILKNDGRFLFNYGAEMFINGNSHQSILILENSRKNFAHSDLYLYLGKNYDELGNFKKAEENYKVASNIRPSKFQPMKLLLDLYIKYDQLSAGIDLAKKIVVYPIKINSDTIRQIKLDARKFLKYNRVQDTQQ